MSELIRIGKTPAEPECDIIFIHGLNGNGNATWSHDGTIESFWPEWLAKDIDHAAVWSLSYDIRTLSWSGGTLPLTDRANNLLSLLTANSIGSRPLAFICHSFGGLLAKQMLHNASGLGDADWGRLLRNVRGVVFLSTPHNGSTKADWFTWMAKILGPSVSTEELKSHDAQLRTLNQWYRNNAPKLGISTSVLYETKPTSGLLIVDPGSADPGIPEVVPIPIDADHFSICKPVSSDAHIYKAVRQRLRAYLSADFSQEQTHAHIVVRIDIGPTSPLSEYLRRLTIDEGSSNFPEGSTDYPAGSFIAQASGAVYFALKKPSVALRGGIEFMHRWHAQLLNGAPDCRIIIDHGRVLPSGAPIFNDIAVSDLDYLPSSALYASESIVDSADRTMATFSRISLPQQSAHSVVFRAEFADPRTVRDSSLIHALFVAHPDAESVRKRLFELFVIEFLAQHEIIGPTKDFRKWLGKRGLPVPEAGWLKDLITSSEYFESTEVSGETGYRLRAPQAAQIEQDRKAFEDAKCACLDLVRISVREDTRSEDALEISDLQKLIDDYLSAVFLEVRMMANYLRRTDQVFEASAAPLKKFDYLFNRHLGGLSNAAAETWRNAFVKGLKRAAEANNIYVASLFHNVLATYYLNRTQRNAQYQREKLQGRTIYLDTNVLYAIRVPASSYHELGNYLVSQLRALGFEIRIFPFSVEEFETSLRSVQGAIHDGVPEPWVLQRLPWIYQEFQTNRSAYFTIQACVSVHSIAKKASVTAADYDAIDDQLEPFGIRVERDFQTVEESKILDLWSDYVNQMASNRWDHQRWLEFRQEAINKHADPMRHDVLSLVNVQQKAKERGEDEFGPKALFLTLDSEHLLRLRKHYSCIVGVQRCQEYFLPYLFLNDVPVKQAVEFPNQLLSAQLGVLLMKYRPKAIEFVESTLRSSNPWQLLDSEKFPTAYKDVAQVFNKDRLREKIEAVRGHPEAAGVVAEQIGELLEQEAAKELSAEYAVRAKDVAISRLKEQVEREKEEKAKMQAELDKLRKANKYFKGQHSRRKTGEKP